ncbi:uncharacterized protein PHALS_07355 [Plasmopara halstedii]|uniref:RxLR-like protein n=1 Tax=Plasmopara halstedii TaxID=4781 RepID=A0A0P1B493_PLAHL|nr:uncharacterized protein PHALS_07355 [Plasmopara halstedii]CEG49599.1 hypothetical protein PHALS_07355 [Plasmopara halstedii]|eukprot:XP_024585968.1 hypothetical protein PHALS_07355 [Plasmopara halstedii]
MPVDVSNRQLLPTSFLNLTFLPQNTVNMPLLVLTFIVTLAIVQKCDAFPSSTNSEKSRVTLPITEDIEDSANVPAGLSIGWRAQDSQHRRLEPSDHAQSKVEEDTTGVKNDISDQVRLESTDLSALEAEVLKLYRDIHPENPEVLHLLPDEVDLIKYVRATYSFNHELPSRELPSRELPFHKRLWAMLTILFKTPARVTSR